MIFLLSLLVLRKMWKHVEARLSIVEISGSCWKITSILFAQEIIMVSNAV